MNQSHPSPNTEFGAGSCATGLKDARGIRLAHSVSWLENLLCRKHLLRACGRATTTPAVVRGGATPPCGAYRRRAANEGRETC